MGQYTEHRCDRCNVEFTQGLGPAHFGIAIEFKYHHPKTIELCERCEGDFVFWFGKHPHGGTPLQAILDGRATGDGYPSREQIAEYKAKGTYPHPPNTTNTVEA